MTNSPDLNATLDIPTSVSLAEQRDAYLKALISTAKAAVPADLALADLRTRAEALLKEETFPSTHQEDWRFTDLSALLSVNFAVAEPATVAESAIAPLRLPETTGAQIVVVNGIFNAALSQLDPLPDSVTVGSLRQLRQNPDLMAKLQSRLGQASGGHEVFTALNTVGFQDAVVIDLPRNGVVDTPVQILYIHQGQETLAQPRCLVVAETGSALTLVEDFWGTGDEVRLTNAVTEIWL